VTASTPARRGGQDCDDRNPNISPRAYDICGDGIDQDCSGSDLACSSIDGDNDGYAPDHGDCDDNDPDVHPGKTEVPYNGKDDDCDPSTPEDDLDKDGYPKLTGGDCDDNDSTIFPGATEVPYDGIDQDCTGGDLTDQDKDGHDATVAGGKDCDDLNAQVHPDIPEVPYDGTDQNCDGSDMVESNTVQVYSGKALSARIDVAFASGRYLAVWLDTDSSAGTRTIYAQRFAGTGQLLGSRITVDSTATSASLSEPRVAATLTDFLVVWRRYESSNYAIEARRVSATTGAVSTKNTVADKLPAVYDLPDVSYTNGRYLVVWAGSDGAGTYSVSARSTDANGAAMGDLLTVHSGTRRYYYPKVGSTDTSDFLVAWHRDPGSGTGYEIESRPVSKAGAVSGGLLALTAAPSSQYYADVAADGTNFLVTWMDFRDGNRDIYGQRVSAAGSRLGGNIAISRVVSDQSYPVVDYCNNSFHAFFSDSRYSTRVVSRQLIDSNGTLQRTAVDRNELVYAESGAVYHYIAAACSATKALLFLRVSSTLKARLLDL
jgi:hypothetical protein